MKTPVKKETAQVREDYLQEQITCLAEDIIDLNEWENETSENLNNMVETLNYNFDAIAHNNENRKNEIRGLKEEINKVDNDSGWCFALLIIWNIVLSILSAFYVFN